MNIVEEVPRRAITVYRNTFLLHNQDITPFEPVGRIKTINSFQDDFITFGTHIDCKKKKGTTNNHISKFCE